MPNSRERRLWGLVVGLSLMVSIPFWFTLAGDAQVHLAIAEQFWRGQPFRYNPGGELVVASTSPFWTLLLTLYFVLAGSGAPLLVKLTSIGVWLGTAVLLVHLARHTWHFSSKLTLGVLALWLGHTVVVANALSGLENVLGALQLLLLYRFARAHFLTRRQAVGMGLLLGWALLTRPDVGLFALLLVSLHGLRQWANAPANFARAIPHYLLLAGVVALVLLPWYAYQIGVTGKFVTDSSLARLVTGRQGAFLLANGWISFHPKTLISLFTAFLPLTVGCGWLVGGWVVNWRRWPEIPFTQGTAVILVFFGALFFSFGVGAEAFGRYFLPLYPFFFLTGMLGLAQMAGWLQKRGWETAVLPLTVLTIFFLVGSASADLARRLGPGRFVPVRTLDVIYGPANRQYYAANLVDILHAPANRKLATDQLLADLQAPDLPHAAVAVTEVQLRYFVDERIEVLSLDGRTSADILAYFDPQQGIPDFAAYFFATRPDFVHVNQWCTVGGWLADLGVTEIGENLVCRWQQQTAHLAIGAQFSWEGHMVRLVAPEIVRIHWAAETDRLDGLSGK